VQEITFNCPSEQWRVAGCGNPCDGKSSSCGPNDGTEYFKKACPQTITYPRDTTNTIFTCPAGDELRDHLLPGKNDELAI
jgi:hypothetical protein